MVKVLTAPQYYAHSLEYAHRSNYHGPRRGRATQVVIHTVQGSYSSCKNWFKNPAANVSAHYVVSATGNTTQMVGENMIAWHVGGANPYTIGIEHEGYAHDGHPPTKAMYHASAKLVAGICYRNNIPVNRSRIKGHVEYPGTHTDPGSEWDWPYFMALVKRYRFGAAPKPDNSPVQSGVVYRVISGSFSHRSNANDRARQLVSKGFPEPWIYQHGQHFRVQAASYADEGNADEMVQRLKSKGFEAYALAEASKA